MLAIDRKKARYKLYGMFEVYKFCEKRKRKEKLKQEEGAPECQKWGRADGSVKQNNQCCSHRVQDIGVKA